MSHLRYPEWWSGLKVALAHDWLTGMRGGERVLELLCDGFPHAPIFTLIHKKGAVSPAIESHPIVVSLLQRVPAVDRFYRYLLPWYPLAVKAWPEPEADLVISTSHCVAKSVRARQGAKHLCYCFTPMRYAWSFYDEYFGRNPIKALLVKPLLAYLRKWDCQTASRVDRFVTLSRHVQARIRAFYGREAAVVYPPVRVHFFTPADGVPAQNYDLIVSALVPYKRIDLAVRAYNRLGFPLVVVGTGTEYARLRSLAGASVRFVGWQSDEQVRELYRHCRYLVFPGEEDFGIVPVEAQACGRPVVAFGKGGVAESVVDGVTGVFFPEQSVDALCDAVARAQNIRWDVAQIRLQAELFSPQRFIDAMDGHIRDLVRSKTSG
jgi:glycosyltransferase involved in cell wall biosynthesis